MRSARVPLLLLLVLSLVGACGVAENAEPREISIENIPEPVLDPVLSTTTTQLPSTATRPFSFYLATTRSNEGPTLDVVERPVSLEPTPVEVVTQLLDLETSEDESDRGLTTNIPADTSLLGAELDAERNLVTLDFNENLLDGEGELQISAFAQIVYTAAELEDVSQVRFLVEGEAIDVRVGDSSVVRGAVDPADYPSYRPTT